MSSVNLVLGYPLRLTLQRAHTCDARAHLHALASNNFTPCSRHHVDDSIPVVLQGRMFSDARSGPSWWPHP